MTILSFIIYVYAGVIERNKTSNAVPSTIAVILLNHIICNQYQAKHHHKTQSFPSVKSECIDKMGFTELEFPLSPEWLFQYLQSYIFLLNCWQVFANRVYNWIHFPRLTLSWWRHQMETFSALLALCAGNSPAPVNSPHKGQWRGALMFSLICARINDCEAGDLRRHRGHHDVNVMHWPQLTTKPCMYIERSTSWSNTIGPAQPIRKHINKDRRRSVIFFTDIGKTVTRLGIMKWFDTVSTGTNGHIYVIKENEVLAYRIRGVVSWPIVKMATCLTSFRFYSYFQETSINGCLRGTNNMAVHQNVLILLEGRILFASD